MAQSYRTRDFFTDDKIVMNMKNCRNAILTNEPKFRKTVFSTYIYMVIGSLLSILGILSFFLLQNLILTILFGGLSLFSYSVFAFKKYYLNGLFAIMLDAIGDNREIDEETFESFFQVLDKRIISLLWFDTLLIFKNLFLPAITYIGLMLVGGYLVLIYLEPPTAYIVAIVVASIISLLFYILFFHGNYLHRISKFMLMDLYKRNGYEVDDADFLYNELKVGSIMPLLLALNVYDVSKEFREYIMFIPNDSLRFSTKLHRIVSKIPLIGHLLGFIVSHIEFFQDIHMLGFKDFVIYAYYSSVYEYSRAQCVGVGKAWVNDDFYEV